MGNRVSLPQPALAVRPQRGAIAIMFAVLLMLILGFMGLALDLSRLYNRKMELQAVADAAALAAARNLTGTASGINGAASAATSAANALKYDYGKAAIPWSSSAIKFATSASSATWMDAGAASASPEAVMFAKADTSLLDPDIGLIDTIFMRILGSDLATAGTGATAIAGRSTINVLPLAICALSTSAASSRSPGGELVQYGFRRGVGYDLMQLNPNPGATVGENFVIDPIDPAGQLGSSNNSAASVVSPFVCTGTMPMVRVQGMRLTVRRPFPLAQLYEQLNSRFDSYNGGYCKYQSSVPDFNVKQYIYNTISVNWMKPPQPTLQTARSATTPADGLRTIADLPNSASNTADQFGVLWSFAKPVPFSAYTPGVAEPDGGYTPFSKSVWPTLFAPAGTPEPKSSYPSTTPYLASGGANFSAPDPAHGKGQLLRRVLNVPLLECPVAAGTNVQANVLAIGRFFMTVPAASDSISAEFAGIAAEGSLGGAVELYK